MCYNADAPSCLTHVKRKARKDHRCCECGIVIHAADVYEYASGIWDGKPDDFKTCEACCILREHVYEEDDCDEYPPFTMLLEAARESASNSGVDYDDDL